MKKYDVVILAGGKGSRIKKYLNDIPKPLLKINNLYFLDYLINNISKYYINKIYILAGFKGEKIKRIYNNKEVNLVPIKVLIEKKVLGTGGSLSLIKNKVSNKFVVLNGDSIFDVDLDEISKIKLKKNECFIALTKNNNYLYNKKLSNLNLKGKNIVKSNKSKFMNGGVYFLNKSFIKNIKFKEKSLENDLIENQISLGKVKGKYYKNFFIDIGTPRNLLKSKKIIPNYFTKPALFLDRDGTINIDSGYTHKIKDFKLMENTIRILRRVSKKQHYIFIVTNQAGIAKGKFKIEDFYKLHDHIKKKFIKKKIYINNIKLSEIHPKCKVKKFNRKSGYRKPGNLMIESLKKRWSIKQSKSYMVGDKTSDFKAATKSNIRFLYLNKNLFLTLKKIYS